MPATAPNIVAVTAEATAAKAAVEDTRMKPAKAPAAETAAMEAAKAPAVEAAAMEAAKAPAVETATMEAATAAMEAAATTAMRLGGKRLGKCQNTRQSGRRDTQAACDADAFHADLASQSPPNWRLIRRDLGMDGGVRLSLEGEIEFNQARTANAPSG